MKFSKTKSASGFGWFLSAVLLLATAAAGCTQNSESENTEIGNVKQSSANTETTGASVNSNETGSANVNDSAGTDSGAGTASSVPLPPSAAPGASSEEITKSRKSAPPAKAPTPEIGSGGNDFFILTQIRGRLSADKELADAVMVDVKEGNITLTGNVPNQAQKKKAEEMVSSVKGVRNIKNNLRPAQ